MGKACNMSEGSENAYWILLGKAEGKRSLGRSRRRWVCNITVDVRERMGWYGQDLAQDRDHWRSYVNTPMKLRVP
jgi:hypothetical protein